METIRGRFKQTADSYRIPAVRTRNAELGGTIKECDNAENSIRSAPAIDRSTEPQTSCRSIADRMR